jgi:hypothetical protein
MLLAQGTIPNLDQISTNYRNDWQLIGYTGRPAHVNHGIPQNYRAAIFAMNVPKQTKVGYSDGV